MKSTINKKRFIIIIIVALLVTALSALLYWQKNNIIALKYALSYSGEEQMKMEKDNEERINEIAREFFPNRHFELSSEELDLYNSGELSESEAADIITGKTTLQDIIDQKEQIESEKATDTNTQKNQDNNESNAQNNEENSVNDQNNSKEQENDKLSNLVAQVYVLRGSFSSQIDSLVSQGRSDLQQGNLSKSELISKYVGAAASLEGSCDAKFDSLMSQINEVLSESGGNKSIVSEIRSAYENEKRIKKAALMSQYF